MLTKEQIEARKSHVGGSDVPTIMGLNPYQTPAELWAEKTNRLEPEKGGAEANLGSRLESAILDEAVTDLGPLMRDVVFDASGRLNFPLVVRLDALTQRDGVPVEAKTMGLMNPAYEGLKEWGDEGTDQVPYRYAVQVMAQMMATDKEVAHIYALLAGRGICRFVVRRSPVVCTAIEEACQEFWSNVIYDRTPEDYSLRFETAKRLRREPDKVIELGDEALQKVKALEAWTTSRKAAEGWEKGLKADLLTMLGDAEVGILPDGRTVNMVAFERKGYTVEPGVSLRFSIKKAGR